MFADYSADGSSKIGFVRVATFWVPDLDAKMSPKQQCRIEGTIFVSKNAPLTEGGKKLPILGTKLVSKTVTILLPVMVSQTGSQIGCQTVAIPNDCNRNEKGSR